MEYGLLDSIQQSFLALWFEVMQFLPELVIALAVLIVGWIVGGILNGAVRKAFKTLKLNQALDKAGVDNLSHRAGYDFKPGNFVGLLVKWFIILAFAIVAFDILGLQQVTIVIRELVLGYLPQVFAAVLILFAGVLLARLTKNVAVATLRAGGAKKVDMFGTLAYYLVIIFTIMAMLNQLNIADELVNILFMGIVFALSLGAGLAFGLGGKEAAGRLVNDLTKEDH